MRGGAPTIAWSPDSKRLAYGNTAEIGLISPTAKITRTLPITDFAAYNTRSTWAWTPALSWSPDGQFLVTQIHSPSPSGESDEDSPAFDVVALQVSGTLQTPLAVGAGMWAAPQWLGTTSGQQPDRVWHGRNAVCQRHQPLFLIRHGSRRQQPAAALSGRRAAGHSRPARLRRRARWAQCHRRLSRRSLLDQSQHRASRAA